MKIQCDVCDDDVATVFCSADEAALCSGCDRRVHDANKLAGKHLRFSLLHPPSKHSSLCDICQEKRAFLFCQQDRAILCKDCDISIHKANEHTQKHNRFLLTGVKLSATSSLYTPSSSSATCSTKSVCDDVPNLNKPASAKLPVNSTIMAKNSEKLRLQNRDDQLTSVSQYLMEMPGWHVEDLLDSSPASFGLRKTSDDLTIWDLDLDLESNLSPLDSSESFGIWVPQDPSPLYSTQYPSSNMSFGAQSKKRMDDSSFTVPQINPPSSVSKRSRIYW